MKGTLWHHHPGVRTGGQLSLGERAADAVRNGMGSWPFVGAAVVLLVAWIAFNSWLLQRAGHHGFDPYPWILLNLMLSVLAGLQGAILLIAAKRADQIASEVAAHTLDNTEGLKSLVDQNTELTRQIHELARTLHDHLLGPASPGGS